MVKRLWVTCADMTNALILKQFSCILLTDKPWFFFFRFILPSWPPERFISETSSEKWAPPDRLLVYVSFFYWDSKSTVIWCKSILSDSNFWVSHFFKNKYHKLLFLGKTICDNIIQSHTLDVLENHWPLTGHRPPTTNSPTGLQPTHWPPTTNPSINWLYYNRRSNHQPLTQRPTTTDQIKRKKNFKTVSILKLVTTAFCVCY